MNIVCATLGDEGDLTSGGAAGVGSGIACGHAKFLKRIESGAQSAGKSKSLRLIVVVDAIERDVGLVAAGAIDRSATAIGSRTDMTTIACVRDACLQAEDAGRFAALEGEIGDLICVEGVSEAGVLSVDDRRGSSDLDDGFGSCYAHRDVQRRWSVDHQCDVAAHLLGETRRADCEFIARGRYLQELIDALVVSRRFTVEPRLRVGKSQRR